VDVIYHCDYRALLLRCPYAASTTGDGDICSLNPASSSFYRPAKSHGDVMNSIRTHTMKVVLACGFGGICNQLACNKIPGMSKVGKNGAKANGEKSGKLYSATGLLFCSISLG